MGANCRERLAPRKKFSFKRKEKSASEKPSDNAAGPAGYKAAASPEASKQLPAEPQQESRTGAEAGALSALGASTVELFEGLVEQAITREPGELASRDVTLRALTGCRVVLLDRIGALHCHSLRRCEIIVGAVSSSALLYDCHECVLTLAAKQLRLHDSDYIALHLHTKSGPVIEHCQRVVLSPYDLHYTGAEAHWAAAELGEVGSASSTSETGAWADMQDFDWHRRQASPNWRIVPAARRRTRIEVSGGAAELASSAPLPPPALGAAEGIFASCSDIWEDAAKDGTVAAKPPKDSVPPAAKPAAPEALGSDDEF